MMKIKRLIIALLIISITATMLTVFASATSVAYGAADVDTATLRLRSGPSTSHTVVALLSEGDTVVILERTNREWYHVNFQGQIGYVSVPLLTNIRTAANFDAHGRVTGSSINIRSRPNTTSSIVGTTSAGATLAVVGINDGWYKVRQNGNLGYIRSDLMEIVPTQRPPTAPTTNAASPRPNVTSPAPPADMELGQQIADYALSYVGYRYVYGGMSPTTGFDCSGLVTYVLRQHDISVTRNASGQFRDNGVHINKSDMVPGDLVFFSNNGHRSVTHVGIYIGGDEFVHASQTGVGVVISSLNSQYYLRVWHGAKRIV